MAIDYRVGGNLRRFIVIHHTGSQTNLQRMLAFFKRKDYKSIHYIVDSEGHVAQYVSESDIAFHAGVSAWGKFKDINPVSIGIEIISNGNDFTDAQRDAVVKLCKDIMKRNGIPAENVLTHAQVAVPRGRKWDVGPDFYVPRWKNWEGFQKALKEVSGYEKEKQEASGWVKKNKISNGERGSDMITREEFWVSLKRYHDNKNLK